MKITKEISIGYQVFTNNFASDHWNDVIDFSIREYELTDECHAKRGNDHFFILDDGTDNLPDSTALYSFA